MWLSAGCKQLSSAAEVVFRRSSSIAARERRKLWAGLRGTQSPTGLGDPSTSVEGSGEGEGSRGMCGHEGAVVSGATVLGLHL